MDVGSFHSVGLRRSAPSRDGLPYCPFFCEENAWHLSQSPALGLGRREVVVVSNPQRQVVMWHQKPAAGLGEGPVVWDYHVWVLVHGPRGARVWDQDSTLGLDVDATHYVRETFQGAPTSFRPQFRVMDSDRYRDTFASDRRHMRDMNGRFTNTPPTWAAIGNGHNLDRFISMDPGFEGDVVDLPGFVARLG